MHHPKSRGGLVVAALTALLVAVYFFGTPQSRESGGERDFTPAGLALNQQDSAVKTPPLPTMAAPTGVKLQDATVAASPTEPVKTAPGWGKRFFAAHQDVRPGGAVTFDLDDDRKVVGETTIMKRDPDTGEVVYVAGTLTQPWKGQFFVRKQSAEGVAGPFVGLFEFDNGRVFRLEPTADLAASVLVARTPDEVRCVAMASPPVILNAPPGPPVEDLDWENIGIPAYQEGVVPLQSLPNSDAVVYLDFNGHWSDQWGPTPIDALPSGTTNAQIFEVWQRVAEDFAAFNINVTTDEAVYDSAPQGSRQRCVITPTVDAAPGTGGVAYIGSFNWTGDACCYAYFLSGKNCAEVISHEIGHTLHLGHDGQTPDINYYGGHGTFEEGWASIMGSGYGHELTTWSKGEYPSANNTQDDLAIITGNNNSIDYRSDDHPATHSDASYLEIFSGTIDDEGVIETEGDVDALRFTTLAAGDVTINASTVALGPNVNLVLGLYDSAGTALVTDDPTGTRDASVSYTALPAGTYTVRVSAAGEGDTTTGYSAYASLGRYKLSGTLPASEEPERWTVAEDAALGDAVGSFPPGAELGEGDGFKLMSDGVLRVDDLSILDYETGPGWFELIVYSGPDEVRVIVTVTDVNEAPTLGETPEQLYVLAPTDAGTKLAQFSVSDPDTAPGLTFSIPIGNDDGALALDPNTGALTIANVTAAQVGERAIQVAVSDGALSDTEWIDLYIVAAPAGYPVGEVSYTFWNDIPGNNLSDLYNVDPTLTKPDVETRHDSFKGYVDHAENFASRLRGYIIPPVSSAYYFSIASDDASDLLLSTDSNRANAVSIANVAGWTSEDNFTQFPSQRSAWIDLQAGVPYYIEAIHKEGAVVDHVSVAWACEGEWDLQIIEGRFVSPYFENFAPTFEDLSLTAYNSSMTNTIIGRALASDVNEEDILQYEILAGNSGGEFALDPGGTLRIAALALQVQTYTLSLRVTDSGGLSADATVTVEVFPPGTIATPYIHQEVWNDMSGNDLTKLTDNYRFPKQADEVRELRGFESDTDFAENYGSRISAYVTPPETGDYTFYIASDDSSQLWLSTDNNPANKQLIANVDGATAPQQWDKFPAQTSTPVTLTAGIPYFIEAIHAEGGGGDHVAVAWTSANIPTATVIPESSLSPYDINQFQAPTFACSTLFIDPAATEGSVVGTLPIIDSGADSHTIQSFGGTGTGVIEIHPNTGEVTLINRDALLALRTVRLFLHVQDDGAFHRYPPQNLFQNIDFHMQVPSVSASDAPAKTLPNLALEASAVASQTNTGAGGDPGRAIDGNTSEWYGNGSITHTAGTEPHEWWEVQLASRSLIDEIVLYNRGEGLGHRLNNFRVTVYDGTQEVHRHEEPTALADAAIYRIHSLTNTIGDRVRVQLLDDYAGPLSLAEVEVYGTPATTTPLEESYSWWATNVSGFTADLLADDDNDGDTNFYEFATAANITPGASATPDGSQLIFTYQRRTDAAALGITYQVEVCTDLGSNSWTPVSPAHNGQPVSDGNGITETVNVYPPIDNIERQFFRLTVSDGE